MVSPHTPNLNIPSLLTQLQHLSATQAAQSEAQQAFHRLLTQLEHTRTQWQAWQDATQAVQQRFAQQVHPQWVQLWQLRAQLVQLLDIASDQAMHKRELQTLKNVIVQISSEGLEQVLDTSLQAIFTELHQRYGTVLRDASTEDATPDCVVTSANDESSAVDWDDPQAVAAYAQAQADAVRAQVEQARLRHRQQRQRAKAQRKAKAQQSDPPVLRTVYRQLASSLHPDRELESEARARKTALMQRVNQAYAAQDLLSLLQLQWEVEQLTPEHVMHMRDAHLERYNAVLAGQLAHLKLATRACERELLQMLGLTEEKRYAPQKMPGMLRQYAQSLQQQTIQLQQLLAQFRNQPDTLVQWLRAQN